MVVVLAGQDMSQQSWPGQPLVDGLYRQRTAHDIALTLQTGILDPRMYTHKKAGRHILKLFTDLFADALKVG